MPHSGTPALVALVRRALAAVAALVLVALGINLVVFVGDLGLGRPVAAPTGDGIVVLTGGRDRIDVAIDLLASHRGQRLLISGVNPTTSAEAIRRTVDARRDLFECCVDLGRRAETTIGNAVETADWVAQHRFGSVVLVTSAYHAPRALLELRSELSARGLDVAVTPYQVHSIHLGPAELMEHPDYARTLAAEFAKYSLARLRLIAASAARMLG